mgnify:CR=1 FL=1
MVGRCAIFEWSNPNPSFLPLLAQASPPFIYRPAHYLKQFHGDFADPATLKKAIRKARVKSWAALHNRRDNMYKFDNPAMPTLQPWINASSNKTSRQLFVRNPYYHRIDARGAQLPYIDVVEMNIVGGGLIAAKANAGEVDLQARGLDFPDISILKKGEAPFTSVWRLKVVWPYCPAAHCIHARIFLPGPLLTWKVRTGYWTKWGCLNVRHRGCASCRTEDRWNS